MLIAVAIGCSDAQDQAEIRPNASGFVLDTVTRIDGHAEVLVPLGFGAPSGAVAVSQQGIIALAQPQDASVRLFGGSGDFLARVGGRGAGPGEFSRVNRIGWKADSLWVVDHGLARVTVFAPDRTPARTISIPSTVVARLPGDGGSIRFSYVRVLEILQGDSLYARLDLSVRQEAPEEVQERVTLGPITPEGALGRVTVRVPVGNVQVNTPEGESITLPFPNRVHSEVSPGGSVAAFVQAFIDGELARQFQVTAVSFAGDTLFQRLYPFDAIEIPQSVHDSVARRRDLPIPDIYPPLAGIVVSSDSSIWVELIETADGRPYLVLGPDGDVLRSVYIPIDMRIAEVRGDRLWAVQTDELGVESVVELALRSQTAHPARSN